MTLYVVTKEGIQCTILQGIYDTELAAIERAQEVKQAEEDDYHSVVVYSVQINTSIQGGEMEVAKLIFDGEHGAVR